MRQPTNRDPGAAVAVSVTAVPAGYAWLQSPPQRIPSGRLATVPLPNPMFFTVSIGAAVARSKSALTLVAALMVTVHVPVPAQPPPLHPANVEPAAGAAVSVTTVPAV
jgi:hypothetical protein